MYLQPVPHDGVDALQEYVPEAILAKVMLVPVLEDVAPLKVTDQLVPEGRPLSSNVTEYVEEAKLAVIVPGAPIVAVVADAVDEPRDIEGLETDQDENT